MSVPAVPAGAKRRLQLCTAIVSLAGLMPAGVSAQSVWNGSTGDFSDGANWSTAPAAPGAGDSASIGAGTSTVITDATVNDIDVSGGTLRVDADLTATGSTTLSDPGRIQISTGGTLASDIGMSSGTIQNSGTIDGKLTMSGGETVNDGTISGKAVVGDGRLTNNFVVNDVDVAAAAEFVNNSGATAGSVTNAGTASNAGTIASLNNTGGSFTNNGGGRITGTTTIVGGTLTNNFVVTEVDVAAAAIFVNNSGATASAVVNAGTASNAGTIATLTNTGGSFTNNDGGRITGATVLTGGTLTNNFVVTDVDVAAAATFVNNTSATAGAVTNAGNSSNAGMIASLENSGGTFTNNDGGTVTGATTVTAGNVVNNFIVSDVDVAAAAAFVNNSGAVAGDVTNAGTASNAGTIASLTNTGGIFANSGAISGDATVTGGTLVNDGSIGGAIDIGADATLAGSGSVGGLSVGSGGTFAPGHGIATVAVDGDVAFREGSTYQVQVDASGLADRLDATGTVAIDGGTVEVLAGAGTYSLATTYTIMTGDSITGAFDEVSSDLAFLSPILTYDPKSVTLGLYRNDVDFADVTETPNARAAAGAVQSLGTENAVFLGVLPLDAGGARNAFRQLSGELHASLKSQLLQQSSTAREAVIGRMKGDVPVLESEGGASVWMTGVAATTRMEEDGNAAAIDGHEAGMFAGIDGAVTDQWRLGGLFGYTNASAGIDADWDTFHAGLYAAAEWGGLGFTGGAIYSRNEISTQRNLAFGTFRDELDADYTSVTKQVFADLGFRQKAGPVALEPFASLAYVHLDTDGFGEKGGGPAALLAGDATDDVTLATLGLRWSADVGTIDMPVTLSGMLGWRHAIGDLTPSSRFSFAGGSPFMIEGVSLSRDALIVEASLSARLTKTARLKIGYSGEFADRLSSHAVRASLVVDF
jgi:subtilase-type serine protease